ncbi:hypothetical protein DL796_04825 [Kangiella spongicola]|uniref:Uncharacterized protein n=1 Tax=Kangiella spongicola TaxID=796379 RepID=A0A318D977_9GAMM|nr:hypothetical protein DL796_04825 [Kangiella spongicola]
MLGSRGGIVSCEVCSRFPCQIRSPQELKRSLRKASELVDSEKLEYLGKGYWGDRFAKIRHGGSWGDFVTNFFRCTHCTQLFHLHAETYHGSGGAFEAIDKIEKNEKFEPENP